MSTPDFGPIDLSELQKAWETVDQAFALLDQADEFHSNSMMPTPRAYDEARQAGFRPYIAAHRLISIAVDYLAALGPLVERNLSIAAPWTLMRAAFEASIWAVWMLEPQDSATRRQRALRREVLDAVQYDKWVRSWAHDRPTAEEHAAEYARMVTSHRADCEALGADWSVLKNDLNVVAEAPKLDAVQRVFSGDKRIAESNWRIMSGHVHGWSWASQVTSTERQSHEVGGGRQQLMTINVQHFTHTATASASLLIEAIKLYWLRSTEPMSGEQQGRPGTGSGPDRA